MAPGRAGSKELSAFADHFILYHPFSKVKGEFPINSAFFKLFKRFVDRCPFAIDEVMKIGYDKIRRDVE